MRKKIIIGNWKMNKLTSEIDEYVNFFVEKLSKTKINCEYGFACSNIDLLNLKKLFSKNKDVIICAQNCFYEPKGAYTGELSWLQLKDNNIDYVIIGHSERRNIFNESDELINQKILSLVENNMKPILCVGESIEHKQKNIQFDFIKSQIQSALSKVNINNVLNITIAYEPIWAIGTNLSANPDEAEKMCEFIRKEVAKLFNLEIANSIRIIYGGSVNEKNASDYLQCPNIDGALVGNASLKPDIFYEIIKKAE